MTQVAERLDFGPASRAAGSGDSAQFAELRAAAAALAGRLDWPDSHRNRPWKYYDAASIGITPAIPLSRISVAFAGAAGFATRVEAGSTPAALGTVVRPETDRITALHYAFRGETAVVNVPANQELAEPVRIKWTVAGSGLAAPHTVIVTGANSRVTVIEEFASGDDELVVLPAAEIVPGPGSEVRHYVIHRWGARTKVFLNQRFLGRERDSAFKNLQMVLSGAVVKGHLESTMQERGTASELLGVTYGTGTMDADFFTLQDHVGPDTRSDLKYKSALTDESLAVYYGLTRVGLGARNADANQENRNLLLSKFARADSDPVLEILTSDIIRASHGATAGPVDQEQLFYMQARGIPRPEAESLLVTAFLEDVLARVPDESVRAELIAMLEETLEA
jgi:Fe-S cluster assembly protein SufD